MFRSGRLLVYFLRISAAMLLLALPAAFLPHNWMAAIHAKTGLGGLPEIPIIGYLTRSVSAMYALHGALILYLSFDITRYLPVIKFLAWMGLAFGAGMFAIDLSARMPAEWTFREGPFIVAESVFILWLAGRVSPQPASTPGTSSH